MSNLTNFKGIYCSGLFIPDDAIVTALSLLFEKIYLPNNISFIREFAKKYRLEPTEEFTIGAEDPFSSLEEEQKQTACAYVESILSFELKYRHLFGDIFETNLFSTNDSGTLEWIKNGGPNGRSICKISSKRLFLTESEDEFSLQVAKGYIPIVGIHPLESKLKKIDRYSAKQIATLLAMKSIELVLPETQGVHQDIILEMRDRLSDYLPPFWSAMLKLSIEMQRRIKECSNIKEVILESQDMVESVILPALIDLQTKIQREEKLWFYKILSPVQKGIRLLIGNPSLTLQQLITSAFIMASDISMGAAKHIRVIESLKHDAGLTFLLEINKKLNK